MPNTALFPHLESLLDQLLAGTIAAIQYGNPSRPCDSALRIVRTRLHRAPQFALSALHRGSAPCAELFAVTNRAVLLRQVAALVDANVAAPSRFEVLSRYARLRAVLSAPPEFFALTQSALGALDNQDEYAFG